MVECIMYEAPEGPTPITAVHSHSGKSGFTTVHIQCRTLKTVKQKVHFSYLGPLDLVEEVHELTSSSMLNTRLSIQT